MNVRRVFIFLLCAANLVAGASLWSNWRFDSLQLAESQRANPVPWGDHPTLVIAADPQTVDLSVIVRDVRRDGHVAKLTIAVIVPDDVDLKPGKFGADVVLRRRQLVERARALADNWNTWALFDGAGDIVDEGPLNGTGLAGVLQIRIARESDLGERAALVMHRAFRDGLFEASRTSEPEAHAILLLSTVGSACGTGEALRQARALRDQRAIRVSVMVPSSWSADEIAALQDSFGLTESPRRVHPDLERRWRELEQTFGENRTAGMLVLIDKQRVKTVYTDRLGILDGLKGLSE